MGTEIRFPAVPELNTSNYDHDDVCRLNTWGIEADARIAELEAKVKVAERSRDTSRLLNEQLREAICEATGQADVVRGVADIKTLSAKLTAAEKERDEEREAWMGVANAYSKLLLRDRPTMLIGQDADLLGLDAAIRRTPSYAALARRQAEVQ